MKCFARLCVGVLVAAGLSQAGYTWKNLKVGGAGFVSGITASRWEKNLVYARTDVGGAYRWDEATGSWNPLLDWAPSSDAGIQGVSAIALDAQDPARVYMVTGISYFGGGKTLLLRSTDRGANFDTVNLTSKLKINGNGGGRHLGDRLAVDPNLPTRLIVGSGSSQNGAFLSNDRGSTWTQITALPTDTAVSFVAFDSSSSAKGSATKIIYVGFTRTGKKNLYRSSDAGVTWSAVTGQDTLVPQRGVVTENGTLHVTYADKGILEKSGKGSVWSLTRAGVKTDITPGKKYSAYSGIHAYPGNPKRLIVSTINSYGTPQCWESRACGWGTAAWGDVFYTTEDGGVTWQNQVSSINNTKTVRLATEAGGPLWVDSGNGNMHWTGSITFDPFNPARAFVTSGNGVFMTSDLNSTTSTTWKFASKGIEEMVTNRMVVLPSGAIVTTIWDYTGFRNASPDVYPTSGMRLSGGKNVALTVAQAKPQYLARFSTGDTGSIALSKDSGKSWSLVPRPVKVAGGNVTFNADGSALLWSKGTSVYRSTNLGTSWIASSWPGAADPEILGDPLNPKLFYAYHASTGNVHVSIDGGASFALKATLQPSTSGNGIESTPGRVGEFWVPCNTGASADGWTRKLIQVKINPSTGAVSLGRVVDKATGVNSCTILGLGRAAPGKSHPSLFLWGNVNNVVGLYRSDDTGSTWVRVNDDRHQFGGPGNGQFLVGDPNVYGRVYMGTFGRGVVYADLDNTAPRMTLGAQWVNAADHSKGFRLFANTLSDVENNVERIDYYVNGVKAGSSAAGVPYNFVYTSVAWNTNYTVRAVAWDKGGLSGNSNTFTIANSFNYALKVSASSPNWVGGLVGTYAVATGSTEVVTGVLSNASGTWKKTFWPSSAGRFKMTSVSGLGSGSYTFTLFVGSKAVASTSVLKL